ncbi:hypothetical protein O9K51_05958 [Purpureocillium lavendulum]|uniref:Uncharacterized protein n=1 Tax=Purpureocillium lavendulum TaxID=1247861 RepID=A0AB34FU43_9HYPO|nr:hypothetical protein O9K51_05958 [Purpureocillium lavendulum]
MFDGVMDQHQLVHGLNRGQWAKRNLILPTTPFRLESFDLDAGFQQSLNGLFDIYVRRVAESGDSEIPQPYAARDVFPVRRCFHDLKFHLEADKEVNSKCLCCFSDDLC